MSGGFFRGTSADQDTRFSNKQAKLMKSQKFAPELENLVDITKVQMDIMKPWIAKRATELLGFEDEVLINFIYGLLEGKIVNGKEIQISLTGFMEKNTGKFMKELWTLLLSAEKNASGVPQQFLDAKEEKARKDEAELDRERNELQKRREQETREREKEKLDKMDGKVDNSVRADNDELDKTSRQRQPRDSNTRLSTDEKEANGRNGSRGRIRGTPSRSNSGSFSNSRSRSEHRSRSISGSPRNRRSDSAERVHRSPVRHSPTPHSRDSPQRSFSPRRRTSYYRQRSISPSNRRSPSPIGRRLRRSRSPVRRRSRSPFRRRPRTPIRRRSPVRRRSRSPIRRRSRSPIRRRSRSPIRRRSRSPIRRRSRSPFRRRSRSPIRRRRSPSPIQRRSPSPLRHRSPSPIRRRSPSPSRRRRRSPSSPRRMSPSPVNRKPPIPGQRRSPTPGSQSSSPRELSPQSPVHQAPDSRGRRSPAHQSSPQNRIRKQEQSSPVRETTPKEVSARSPETGKGSTLERRAHISSQRTSQRGRSDRNILHRGVRSSSPSLYNSPAGSKSPPPSRMESRSRDRRASSPHVSPRREPVIDDIRPSSLQKPKVQTAISVSQQVEEDLLSSEAEDPKRKSSGKKTMHLSTPEELKLSAQKANCDVKGGGRHESVTLNRMSRIDEERNNQDSDDSDYGVSDKHIAEVGEKRKHKRSKRQESDDDHSSDSQLEGRKKAKKRRKEEKKLRKEERRRRREERRRRKDERRADKVKLKAGGAVSPPSDFEENDQSYSSDGARAAKRDSRLIDSEEQSEQRKLEIALREKAIETLRAKKGTGH